MIAIEEFCQALNLEPLTQTTRKEMDINVTDLNRPGMQFCGFYEFFAAERPQVIGKVEMTYLESIEPTVREKVLRRYMSYDLPCIVCCWGMTPPSASPLWRRRLWATRTSSGSCSFRYSSAL